MTTKPLTTLTSLSILLFAAAMTSACNIDAKDMAEDLEDHFSIEDELDLDSDDWDDDTQSDDRDNDHQTDEMPIIEGEWFGTLTVDEEVFEVYFDLEQEDDFAIGFGGTDIERFQRRIIPIFSFFSFLPQEYAVFHHQGISLLSNSSLDFVFVVVVASLDLTENATILLGEGFAKEQQLCRVPISLIGPV